MNGPSKSRLLHNILVRHADHHRLARFEGRGRINAGRCSSSLFESHHTSQFQSRLFTHRGHSCCLVLLVEVLFELESEKRSLFPVSFKGGQADGTGEANKQRDATDLAPAFQLWEGKTHVVPLRASLAVLPAFPGHLRETTKTTTSSNLQPLSPCNRQRHLLLYLAPSTRFDDDSSSRFSDASQPVRLLNFARRVHPRCVNSSLARKLEPWIIGTTTIRARHPFSLLLQNALLNITFRLLSHKTREPDISTHHHYRYLTPLPEYNPADARCIAT
ncbi:uncharacterized protein SPSK_06484 [Sporothrix schenckii 1099-18]|uniref:Uncharacterized protein n=1 Tax=Sporothrix schenckii 1099-18 TaxID=1397361 RepID=A0A0F2MIJ3_SPOSC|nr:uncharacterized protein SPSK_06484 [Sporothrix schenckii 1099-18]KJR89513.1 hypothetical protein SPSK_06484 [Sporothrix schenckii 1099-18]